MLLDIPLLTALNIFGHLWAISWQEFNLAVNSKKNLNHQHTKEVYPRGLSKNELFQKEKVVFDEAILSIAQDHWKSAKFDGSPVIVYPVLCDEDDLLYDDCKATKEFFSCPIHDMHKYDIIKTSKKPCTNIWTDTWMKLSSRNAKIVPVVESGGQKRLCNTSRTVSFM
jgi:hypothetical protein